MIEVENLALKIPAGFIKAQMGQPRWSDLLFGLENNLLDPAAIAEFASDALVEDDAPPEALELAVSVPGEPVLDQVRRLAGYEEPTDIGCRSTRVWVFLALAWLLAHRAALSDPLASVEAVYSKFDYPESIAGFVRYMPSDEPDLGERGLNEERLICKWGSFLEEEREVLSRP